jgi:signal transduction histidine kinase
MSEEVIEKLFVPFFTTKDVGEGTGLGLPVAHGIVISHKGTVRVQSTVGRGTRFEITLPVAEAERVRCSGPCADVRPTAEENA